jgi:predicted O-methyltransferase YrrM
MGNNVVVDGIIEEFDRFGILPHALPNAIGMWPNEQECLVWCALQANPFFNWLEIGSFCGGSAILLAITKQRRNNARYRLVSVDNNFNPLFDYNVFTRGNFGGIVQRVECDSKYILDYYNEPLSFIFLDGWHSFSAIINEFNLLKHLMTDDCIIGFHDVSPKMCNMDYRYITKCYSEAKEQYDQLMNDSTQNFRLDEAIAFICGKYDYQIMDIPVRNDETHFQETRLTEWVRGTTSPVNSFTAIQRTKQ